MRFVSSSPEHTRKVGKALGRLLQSRDIVALVGMLGAGKTVFAQGLAQGLDVEPDEYVTSPSFAIVNQYRGRVPVFHIDTYRLASEAEMVSLGYEDYFEPDGVTIIEWADRVRELLPQKYMQVKLEITGLNSREIEIKMVGKWQRQMMSAIETALSRMSIEET